MYILTITILLNWTVLLGQDSDSVCYSQSDLKKIAQVVIKKQACEEQLSLSNIQIAQQNAMIDAFRLNTFAYQNIIRSKDSIISLNESKFLDIEMSYNDKISSIKKSNMYLGALSALLFTLLTIGYIKN